MRPARLFVIGIMTVLFVALGAWAGETPAKTEKDPQNLPHTAVYKVPDLTTDLSKALVKSLSGIDGILSAKPDTEAGTLAVTFAPAKTDPETIENALERIAPNTALGKVGPADPKQAKSGCDKCPKSSACGKKKD